VKQRITTEQLQELTPEQQQKLRELRKPTIGDVYFHTLKDDNSYDRISSVNSEYSYGFDNCLPLIGIGQMIEFLEDDLEDSHHYCEIRWCKHEELCDVLWQMTKEFLSRM
jgi:hypothetical protein